MGSEDSTGKCQTQKHSTAVRLDVAPVEMGDEELLAAKAHWQSQIDGPGSQRPHG